MYATQQGAPQQQPTVVVVSQPGKSEGGQQQNIREWSTGIFGCMGDCCNCMYAFLCFPCFMCTLASELNECCCGPLLCDRLFTVAMRTKVRTMYGIKGSILGDCCCVTCCQFCAMTQIHREIKHDRALM